MYMCIRQTEFEIHAVEKRPVDLLVGTRAIMGKALGQDGPTRANTGKLRPAQANTGHHGPTQAITGQHRPTRASTCPCDTVIIRRGKVDCSSCGC